MRDGTQSISFMFMGIIGIIISLSLVCTEALEKDKAVLKEIDPESYLLHRNEVKDFVMGRYLLSNSPMTQSQALSYCEAGGMQLVAIGNGVENNDVTQFLEFTNLGFAWTSGKPMNYEENSYRWVVNNELVQFMKFQQELPHLIYGEEEWSQTGILLSPISDQWLLEWQTETHHAMCEKR